MFGIIGYINPSIVRSIRIATSRTYAKAALASWGNSSPALACRAIWFTLFDTRANNVWIAISSAIAALRSVGVSDPSDKAAVMSRFGTVTFSRAARATRAASSSAVTHTSRRFFVPAGEFDRRRFEIRERGTLSSDTHSPNPFKRPSAATPKPGTTQASVPSEQPPGREQHAIYTRVNV